MNNVWLGLFVATAAAAAFLAYRFREEIDQWLEALDKRLEPFRKPLLPK